MCSFVIFAVSVRMMRKTNINIFLRQEKEKRSRPTDSEKKLGSGAVIVDNVSVAQATLMRELPPKPESVKSTSSSLPSNDGHSLLSASSVGQLQMSTLPLHLGPIDENFRLADNNIRAATFKPAGFVVRFFGCFAP